MTVADLINKSQDAENFTKEELTLMLSFPSDSPEAFRVMAEASRISKELSEGFAEVHAQFSLDLAPCSCNCRFCSFAAVNGVFGKSDEISADEAVEKARSFEKDGANAVFIMTSADYPFKKFIEMSREIRRSVSKETVLIANVGDRTQKEAELMTNAGYRGVYHALRLREGRDTSIDPEKRKASLRAFHNAGLKIGTCVEPVGPEHTNAELAEMILFTASLNPVFSGAARRITIPGGALEKFGMISELRMAQIVAVTRLGMPRNVPGNCTHEPCTLGALAGANLFWAEAGANPRDTKEKTEEGRGGTVAAGRRLFRETGWETLSGPSRYYSR
ncbi:MAG TPA: radical SAM protein [bacterium]|nr:radical SAM protein [bacterium]